MEEARRVPILPLRISLTAETSSSSVYCLLTGCSFFFLFDMKQCTTKQNYWLRWKTHSFTGSLFIKSVFFLNCTSANLLVTLCYGLVLLWQDPYECLRRDMGLYKCVYYYQKKLSLHLKLRQLGQMTKRHFSTTNQRLVLFHLFGAI